MSLSFVLVVTCQYVVKDSTRKQLDFKQLFGRRHSNNPAPSLTSSGYLAFLDPLLRGLSFSSLTPGRFAIEDEHALEDLTSIGYEHPDFGNAYDL